MMVAPASFSLSRTWLRERLDLPVGLGGGDDQRVVEAGELADVEDGDVARFDVLEGGDGGLLQFVRSHPGVIDRV